ncbi:ankyrin repeat-containing domain protein [Aspergillus oleicola]
MSTEAREELKGIQETLRLYRLDALTEEQNKCLQSFNSCNYESRKNVSSKPEKGTCDWVLQSEQYLRWKNDKDSKVLWISADPDCGKSVLSRSLVYERLKEHDPEATVCYFFFKEGDDDSLAMMLRAILHQLFRQKPDLIDHAMGKATQTNSADVDTDFLLLEAASRAARNGHAEVIKILIDEVAGPDEGYPLLKATRSGHTKIVKQLIKAGADVDGGYPLHAALIGEHILIARILIDNKANVNAEYNGQNTFEIASALHVLPIVKYILEKKRSLSSVKLDRWSQWMKHLSRRRMEMGLWTGSSNGLGRWIL